MKLTSHLKEQNETYFEHMLSAWKIVHVLMVMELKCLIHSFIPVVYQDAVSGKIEHLRELTKRSDE